jgi:hypothetical protein
MLKSTLEKVARVGRSGTAEAALTDVQRDQLAKLRKDGYVAFDHLVGTEKLALLQAELKQRIEHDLDFEYPCLAQTRIDPERDADMIASNFLATNAQLKARNLTFDRDDAKSYDQVVTDFEPSSLKVFLPDTPLWLGTWLDPVVLPVVEAYMKFRPELTEAYIRRNFPAKFVVMNHAWHRDRNHPTHLLKAFVFLNDCTLENGPHHYIAGSVQDRRMDGQNYYSEEDVRRLYPAGGPEDVVSVVPAGTIILEDTRGLHKAGMPQAGFRDLGFVTFLPPIALARRSPLYTVSRGAMQGLSAAQAAYIPKVNILG